MNFPAISRELVLPLPPPYGGVRESREETTIFDLGLTITLQFFTGRRRTR
jgi:hypothetical protein